MENYILSEKEAAECLRKLHEAVQFAENEEQVKIRCERVLEDICLEKNIAWNAYTYEHTLAGKKKADAIHGATVIEYEAPCSFRKSENALCRHARLQVETYTTLLAQEEGRPLGKYSLVACDGETITFGHFRGDRPEWESVRVLDALCLNRLLTLIADGGRPLVSPAVLRQIAGPETEIGTVLIPAFFQKICHACSTGATTRTRLIFSEWLRLFGQVDGVQTEEYSEYIDTMGRIHNAAYHTYPHAYVFTLNTYIAIIAKICAVYALSLYTEGILPDTDDPAVFLRAVEDDAYFRVSGIQNMLNTDFFSWYIDEKFDDSVCTTLGLLLERLRTVDFDISRKSPDSIRDFFKGLYMEFIPSSMRHALGEYYTPDWLAAHVLDQAGWKPDETLLDPTCGSGTFVLEALRRRLEVCSADASAEELLSGLYGSDLNPLAVLTTKASVVIFLSQRFSAAHPVLLPVFLADAINTADAADGVFRHDLLTEKGIITLSIPECIARSSDFFAVMDLLRTYIHDELDEEEILEAVRRMFPVLQNLSADMFSVFSDTVHALRELHANRWNGIWCFILFDRIRAGCVRDVDLVVGNPPWVRWSSLPEQYTGFIKPVCRQLRIFSDDSWVGGIESDISAVVTYRALTRFVRKGGRLAFLLTGTLLKNESSQGFRRWNLWTGETSEPVCVTGVEDYSEIRPFEGVSNRPVLLLIHRNSRRTEYPVPFRRYMSAPKGSGHLSEYTDLLAMPVPGTSDGPWITGTQEELAAWQVMYACDRKNTYRSRKGITTDLNGVFFVHAETLDDPGLVRIANDAGNGRTKGILSRQAVVERTHVFPLLRGRDIRRFHVTRKHDQYVIVPQRGMYGDPDLPVTDPLLYAFLRSFRPVLETRSSYRRFQKGRPFWSVWSTGAYTFAPYKVVWKELSGQTFVAAYVGQGMLGEEEKVIIPDHKVYFIPVDSEDEAAYLTAFLNARSVSGAIRACASSLSLGTSVTEYIRIPTFDRADPVMCELARMAETFSSGMTPTDSDERRLDGLVARLLS